MKDMMIGVDPAKNVFQVHGALRTGEVHFRRKLTRTQFSVFMAQQERCLVIFEACGSAHYWAHEMEALGRFCSLICQCPFSELTSFSRLRLPLFSSNSMVHDGVGWVRVGKVETAIVPLVPVVATESSPCLTPSLGRRPEWELWYRNPRV